MAAAADDQQPVASAIDAYQANVLFLNGFGLQPLPQEWLAESLLAPFSRTSVKPPTLTDFIVCMCNRYTPEELDKLREIVPGLKQDDFVGHNYLQVPWHEYDRIEQLMNAVLQTRDASLACKCYPKYARGSVFAWSTFEQKMIEAGRFSTDSCQYRLPSGTERLTHAWLWVSAEGLQFCQELQSRFPHDCEQSDKDNFFKWPAFAQHPCKFYAPGRGQEIQLMTAKAFDYKNINQ